LGARLGGDEALGDRVWRRVLHGIVAVVLLYYALPDGFFVVAPKRTILLAALAAILGLELLRHAGLVELPTIRSYESGRIGSYAFYALAVVGAIVLFPEPIAVATVLGTALVDPIAGEIRARPALRRAYPGLPLAVYAVLAWAGLGIIGRWPPADSVGLALLAAPIAVAAEWPTIAWLDDDLAMTFAPAIALYLVGVVGLGLPR
jgi:dolichol kinase